MGLIDDQVPQIFVEQCMCPGLYLCPVFFREFHFGLCVYIVILIGVYRIKWIVLRVEQSTIGFMRSYVYFASPQFGDVRPTIYRYDHVVAEARAELIQLDLPLSLQRQGGDDQVFLGRLRPEHVKQHEETCSGLASTGLKS
jgi:hypothetical protein